MMIAMLRTGISFFMGCAFNAPPFDVRGFTLFDGRVNFSLRKFRRPRDSSGIDNLFALRRAIFRYKPPARMNIISTLPCLIFSMASAALGATTTFSFTDDIWTNGVSTQVGYLDGALAGSLTKAGVTVTFSSSFIGSSTAATRNLTYDTGNPSGFVFGSNTDANDLNGNLANYQRWDFSFSQPILIQNLILDDVDSDNPNPLPSTGGFRDAIAGEGFITQTPGTLGSGLAVSLNTETQTDLIPGTISTANGGSLNYVISGPGNNPNNSPRNRVSISFGTTPVSSFSLYGFSDRNSPHRVTMFQGMLEVEAVPEPATAALSLLGGLLLLRRRR